MHMAFHKKINIAVQSTIETLNYTIAICKIINTYLFICLEMLHKSNNICDICLEFHLACFSNVALRYLQDLQICLHNMKSLFEMNIYLGILNYLSGLKSHINPDIIYSFTKHICCSMICKYRLILLLKLQNNLQNHFIANNYNLIIADTSFLVTHTHTYHT